MIFKKIVFIALATACIVSCTKYGIVGDGEGAGNTSTDVLSVRQATAALYGKTTFKLGAKADGYHWYLDGKEVSTASTYEFSPVRQGVFEVELRTSSATYTTQVYAVRPVSDNSSKWISDVVEYLPAPGQFINTDAWGTMANVQAIVGPQEANSVAGVSLGAFGGYIVFKFDHSVLNKPGYDFVIRGNAFEGSSEPGAVMVAFDKNGNGVPDQDEWYELAGEDYVLESTKKNYTVTYTRPDDLSKAANVYWTASDGGQGMLSAGDMDPFHKQPYWPLFIPGNPAELSFTGNCLRCLTVDQSGQGSEHWDNKAAGGGYADNYSKDYDDIVNLDEDTKRSNKFDIVRAIDASGQPVTLPAVDFVKVYTCINQSAGWLGEGSTEVCGAISLSASK